MIDPTTASQPVKMHVHFGAGKLGIGAVLPVLHPNLPLVVVQAIRAESLDVNWGEVHDRHKRVMLRNDARIVRSWQEGDPENREEELAPPYRRWFQCIRRPWMEGDVRPDDLQWEPDKVELPLVIVDHFKQVASIVARASSVSCALNKGQSDLAELLAECTPDAGGVPVLAFENTLELDEKTVEKLSKCGWHILHTITDRVCSRRKPPESDHCILVECEEYLSIVVAESAIDCFNPQLLGTGRPVHPVPEDHLKFHAQRKRALVNSLHQLIAVFCFGALSQRGFSIGGQYLAPIMAWFERNHPDLYHSIELYKRLRALQLVWPLIESDPRTEVHAEAARRFYAIDDRGDIYPQQVYDALLQEARAVIDRFSKAPDELRRLIDPRNLRRELQKYQEHVLEPIHFMWSKQDQIVHCPLFDKPNVEDLKGLEDVLTKAFLVAMDTAMSASKGRSQ